MKLEKMKKHEATGLYETTRYGKKNEKEYAALERDDRLDAARPSFVEQGNLPESLTAEELEEFRFTKEGSTFPKVGNVGGRNYIVKCGHLPSGIRNHDDLEEHIRKEVAADAFIRMAGLNCPSSHVFELESNGQRHLFKIAEYVTGGVSLRSCWNSASSEVKDTIRRQIIAAYPVMSFLANIDVFQNDNALVDSDNRVWFVDNGACFQFRAQGGDKKTRLGWDFYARKDPADPKSGFFWLRDLRHSCSAYSQDMLRNLLSGVSDRDLIIAAKKYSFAGLVKTLPEDIARPELVKYANELDEWIVGK